MNLKLYSAQEVADLIGIKLDTLYRYVRSGRVRGMKIGKAWKFSESDIQEFIEQHRQGAAAGHPKALLLPDILSNAATMPGIQSGITFQGETLSYAEVHARAARLASALLAEGLCAGDRVIVLLPNSVEFIISCFAVWKAGGVLVPEDPAIKSDGLGHILQDSKPAAMIVDRPVAERMDAVCGDLESVKTILVKDRTFALSGLDRLDVKSLDAVLSGEMESPARHFPAGRPGDVASITYTSGTTGRPKGVMHTHESWLAGASFTRDYHGLTQRDSIVIPLPLHHGLAFRQILAYVLAGAPILLAADIYQALKLMRDHRPSAAVLVPAGVNILLDHFVPVLQELAPSLRYLEIGSAPLGADRFNQLRRLLPSTFIHLPYGLTEARVGFLKAGADGRLNRIAKVSPDLEFQLINEQGAKAGPGQSGEIVLRGRGLMKGYWGQSETEMAALKEHGFRTGDMGVMDEQGEVALLGRKDEMLKVGGHKVNPEEVEAALRRHPAVAECVVLGLPDPTGVFETKLHAFVVPQNKNEAPADKDLDAHCRQLMESFKVPSHFHFHQSLPRSSVGKILRQNLKTSAMNTAGIGVKQAENRA